MAGIPPPPSSSTGASSSLPVRPQSAGASAISGALRNAETGTGAQPLAAGTAGVVVERKSLFARVLDTARDVGRVLTGKVWEEALEGGLLGAAGTLQRLSSKESPQKTLKTACEAHFNKSNDAGEAFVHSLSYEELSTLLGLSNAPISPTDTLETRRQAAIANYSRNHNQSPPLIVAAWSENITELNRLLALPGIDLNVVNADGDTALMVATKEGKDSVIALLLNQQSIDINAKNNNGHTALILAAWMGKTDAAIALMSSPKIDVNITNKFGGTALTCAGEKGHLHIANLLINSPSINLLGLRNVVASAERKFQVSNLVLMGLKLRYSILQRLFEKKICKAEYHATILGNFISLKAVRLPNGVTPGSRLGQIFRSTAGYTGLSLNYLIAAWDDFQKLSLNGEYVGLQVAIKTALGNLMADWKNNDPTNNDTLSATVQNGAPCSWTVAMPEHLMGMSVSGDRLILSNLGGIIDLASGNRSGNKNSLVGEMVFDISKHRSLFTADFMGKLRGADAEALEALYKLPKVGYIGKRGQNRGNCAFDHPKLFIENHIYFEFLKEEEKLSSSQQSSSSSAASSSSASSRSSIRSTSEKEDWESTRETDILKRVHGIEQTLPSGETVPCLNQDGAVKHARRIFRDFTLFGRIKALVDFANYPHAVEYMRAILPEEHKGEAERLVNEAVMEGWKKISEMIQKRTAYKAAEEPDWTKRGYNTVEGGSIVDGLLAQLGDDPQTDAAKLLRDAIIEAKTKEGAT